MSRAGPLVASGCCDKRTGKSVVSGQFLLETGSDFRRRKGEIDRALTCVHLQVHRALAQQEGSGEEQDLSGPSQATTTRNFEIFKSADCRG